jgi:hypothetical protein
MTEHKKDNYFFGDSVEILKVRILINTSEDADIIQLDTNLRNPFCSEPECTMMYSFDAPKNTGVKYVMEEILPGCTNKPEVEVVDYKIRKLTYKLDV